MKTIVYLSDNSVESTVRADEFVAAGKARFATAKEAADYERNFERDDSAYRNWMERCADESSCEQGLG